MFAPHAVLGEDASMAERWMISGTYKQSKASSVLALPGVGHEIAERLRVVEELGAVSSESAGSMMRMSSDRILHIRRAARILARSQ